jgi:hypothetical protein
MEALSPKKFNYINTTNFEPHMKVLQVKHDFKHVCYVGIAWDSITMQNCFQVVKNKMQKNTPPSLHMNV